MKVEDLINIILEQCNISKEDIYKLIEEKKKKFKFLTDEGALYLIANELGVNLFVAHESKEVKIGEITPDRNYVNVVGKVLRIFQPRTFEKKGFSGKVCSIILADNTGRIRLVFWNKDVEKYIESGKIKEGDVIKVINAMVKENRFGDIELHVTGSTIIKINPEGIDINVPTGENVKISQLSPNMYNVSLIAKILRILPIREIQRFDGSIAKVANVIIADDTGKVRLSIWDENVDLIKRLKEGETIKVINAYVRERFGEKELVLSRIGKIVPCDEEVNVQEENLRKNIKDLKNGEIAEIKGIIIDVKNYKRIPEKNLFIMNLLVDDSTEVARLVFFNKRVEELLNIPLEELLESENIDEIIESKREELIGKEIIVLGRCKETEFGKDIIVDTFSFNIDYIQELNRLIDEAKKLLNIEKI